MHSPGSCGRENCHTPCIYDKAAHKTQWNKENNNSSSNDDKNLLPLLLIFHIKRIINLNLISSSKKLSVQLVMAMGHEIKAYAFLAAYGIESEEPKK